MAARDSEPPSEEGYSSEIPKEHLSMRQYRASGKSKARYCSHFTYSWDNHPVCLSCSLWLGKGEWGGFSLCTSLTILLVLFHVGP